MTDYVLKREVIKDAFWNLVRHPVHANFPGYLAILWLAHRNGSTDDIAWGARAYDEFFDRFFSVKGGAVPYLKPFSGEVDDPDREKFWFGSNLAGTYGVGHINSRTDVSETVLVEDEDRGGVLSLLDDHSSRAKEHLLYGGVVSADDVAMYLYRDFTFEGDSEPEVADVVELFKEEFGYGEDDEDFNRLFVTGDGPDDAFEVYDD